MIEFINNNPGIVVACFLILGFTIYFSIKASIKHLTIMVRGWPPSHCDADGDIILEEDDDNEDDDNEDDGDDFFWDREETEDMEGIPQEEVDRLLQPTVNNTNDKFEDDLSDEESKDEKQLTKFDIMRKDNGKN